MQLSSSNPTGSSPTDAIVFVVLAWVCGSDVCTAQTELAAATDFPPGG